MNTPQSEGLWKRFTSAALCTVILLLTTPVHAALLDPVSVDGRDWLQPVDFINTSWNDVAAVCSPGDGICSGDLNGSSLDGWTWASVFDVQQLINFFDPFNARSMLTAGFEPTERTGGSQEFSLNLDGYTRTLGSFGGADHLVASYSYSFGYVIENSIWISGSLPMLDRASEHSGHFFFRGPAFAVPVPHSGVLFAIALACLLRIESRQSAG